MAEKAAESAGKNGMGGENGLWNEKTAEGGDEQEKRKRGRPRKEEKEKEREKAEKMEVIRMKNYLKKGNITGQQDEIIRGKELQRTPVKKCTRADGKEGSIGSDGEDEAKKGSDDNISAEEREARNQEVKDADEVVGAQDRAEAASLSNEKKDEEVSVSEWKRGMEERMFSMRQLLREIYDDRKELKEEIRELKERGRGDAEEIDRLKRVIEEIKIQAEIDRERICELEREEWMDESERASGSGSRSSKGSKGSKNTEQEDVWSKEDGTRTHKVAEAQNNITAQLEQHASTRDAAQGKGGNESEVRLEGQNVVERGYLKNVPTALSENEFLWEMKERKSRKKNIFIRGIRTVGKRIINEIKGIVREYMNLEIYISNIRALGGGVVVELESFENKVEILKRKRMLKGIDLWLEDDYTAREKQVQEWLEKIAKEEGRNGLETKVGYQKIKVKEEWYKWNEIKGQLEEMCFRGGGQGK